jgi:hypothetical protein
MFVAHMNKQERGSVSGLSESVRREASERHALMLIQSSEPSLFTYEMRSCPGDECHGRD